MKWKKLTNLFICITCVCFWVLLMAGWSYTYDTATPAGTDDPSEADDRMREIKAALQERLAVNHFFDLTGTEVSDADAGEHTKITYHVTLADPAQVAGKADLYMQADELRYQDDTNAAFDLTSGGSLGSAGTDLLANDAAFGGTLAVTGTLDVAGNIDPTAYETTNGGFIDDDTMATAADTVVASAESVVAYIGTEVSPDIRIKAWTRFDGTDTITNGASYNVTSVVRDSAGLYTITWDTDFSNAYYCATVTTNGRTSRINAQAAGTLQVATYNSMGVLTDASIVCVKALGDQ